jgi:hypothetical protein
VTLGSGGQEGLLTYWDFVPGAVGGFLCLLLVKAAGSAVPKSVGVGIK